MEGVLEFGHPLLDRVAECSTRPTVAIEFFSHLFWPLAENRLAGDALWHPYIDEISENLVALSAKQGPSASEGVQQSGRECCRYVFNIRLAGSTAGACTCAHVFIFYICWQHDPFHIACCAMLSSAVRTA